MKEYFSFDKFPSDNFADFQGTPIPGCYTPNYFDVFNYLGLTAKTFSEKANILFDEYKINVPSEFKVLDSSEFAICVSCCIIMKEKYSLDVSKIIRKELIDGKKIENIRHASSLASVALYYLNLGYKVEIIEEKEGEPNPDLLINELQCEIKVIQESNWITNYSVKTGKTEEHELFLDLCFDMGEFIKKKGSGFKGIKQSQIIFADLSLKSFGWLKKILDENKDEKYDFPELKESSPSFLVMTSPLR
jgi:hypothetical protein